MHNRLSPGAFAAISVSIDELTEDGIKAKLLKFLESQNATFSNYLLDEKPEFWQEKLKFDGPPCVFVFNQKGQIARQFKGEFTYADVEKLVKELLEKK
jgi:hypothetical protein